MSLLKSLAGETVIYGLSNILNRLVQFILLTPYLTHIFQGPDKELYGVHGIMYAFAGLLMVIFTFRMETAYFRFASQNEFKKNAFATASFPLIALVILMILGVCFNSEVIADLLTNPRDSVYVQYFAFIVGLDVLSAIPFAKLRLEKKPYIFVAIKTVNIILMIGFTLFWLSAAPRLVESGYDLSAVYQPGNDLAYVFLANLIASGVTFLLLVPIYFKSNWNFDFAVWKKMLAYSAPLVIVGIAIIVNQLSDRWFISKLLPGTEAENMIQVGIYNGCIKIAVLINLFTTAFNYAAEPFFFRNADRSDAKDTYALVAKAFTMVGSLAFLGVLLYLDIFKHLIAEDYWSGLIIVPFVLMANVLLGLYYNIAIWFKLTNKTIYGAAIAVGAAIITIGMNIWLIPKMGYIACAITLLSAYSFMVIVGYVIGKKHYPVPYDVKRILGYLIAAVGFYLFSELLATTFAYNLPGKLIVNTIILGTYLGLFWIVDKSFIQSFYKRS